MAWLQHGFMRIRAYTHPRGCSTPDAVFPIFILVFNQIWGTLNHFKVSCMRFPKREGTKPCFLNPSEDQKMAFPACRSQHLSTSTQPKNTLWLCLLPSAKLLCSPPAFWVLPVSASPGLSASLSQSTRKQELAKAHPPTEVLCVAAFVVSRDRDPCPGWLRPWDGFEAATHLALGESDGWREGCSFLGCSEGLM